MSRIGAIGQLGSAQLGILHALQRATQGLADSTERLATLKKINRSADDPAGLVQAQKLESDLKAIDAAQTNVTRATSLISTADAAASDIVSKLEDAQTLALEVAGGGLTSGEIASKQAALDEILASIDRTAQTSYDGRRLLDGSSGYYLSGVDTSKFKDVDVINKTTSAAVTVNVTITQQATKGTKQYTGGALGSATTLEVTGALGTTSISLASGASTQDITDAFNAASALTGITATRVNGTTVNFFTTGYGSAQSITITPTTGTFTTTGTGTGLDTIATVNGTSFTGSGLSLNATVSNVSLNIDFDSTATGALTAFTVSGTGLQYSVSTDPNDIVRIGPTNLTTTSLGGTSGKLSTLKSGQANTLTGANVLTAITIINDSLDEARAAESRLGAFQKYTLDSAASVLNSQQENLDAEYSDLMDVDVADETTRMTKQQLLQQSALQALQILTLQSGSPFDLLMGIAARM